MLGLWQWAWSAGKISPLFFTDLHRNVWRLLRRFGFMEPPTRAESIAERVRLTERLLDR